MSRPQQLSTTARSLMSSDDSVRENANKKFMAVDRRSGSSTNYLFELFSSIWRLCMTEIPELCYIWSSHATKRESRSCVLRVSSAI
jgi:hypothetical protein